MMCRILALLAVLVLSACAADNEYAPDAAVAQARFVAGEPSSITLFTVLSTRNGTGAHSGLLINGTERVMFDPAGTWQHPALPERHDMHYGMSDKMVLFYIDYHARETFDVLEQKLVVTPEQAALIKARAQAYGAAKKGFCSRSISSILAGVPGFESIKTTFQPKTLADEFGRLPGVVQRTITDDDADENHGVLLVQAAEVPELNGNN